VLLNLKCQFSGSLSKVEIGEIICRMIPSGSGYFVRLDIFLPEGLGRFGKAFRDFAIRLAILGCRGAIIHTVSR